MFFIIHLKAVLLTDSLGLLSFVLRLLCVGYVSTLCIEFSFFVGVSLVGIGVFIVVYVVSCVCLILC